MMFNLPEISISGSPEAYSRKVDGVMVAVVTNNNDPDQKGRVKLKLPLQESDRNRLGPNLDINGR
jgi:uncharacterized protein involved in type VI secretion and phage assembly